MGVRLALLGTVSVHVEERDVDVGHARQRCVLAALMLRPNVALQADDLIDQVWGECPPTSPRQALRSYVSRLRTALVDVSDVAISGGARGYRLDVDAGLIDLHRFRKLTAEALVSGDAAAAVLYDRALRLWRGEPLAGFDSPSLNVVREGLRVELLTTQLDLHDVRLRLGEHQHLLPKLQELAAAHPVNERLIGQLMLALYRGGQQAEALREYERIRQDLAEELGTDPGPRLRDTHREILRGADQTPTPVPVHHRPVPRQLPPRPHGFIGRLEHLAAVRTAAAPIITISGAGGIGKTMLALHWAHQHIEEFPDGQLFLNLRGFDAAELPMSTEFAVSCFLDALGVAPVAMPETVDAQVGLYRSLVVDKRMLIVLDNAADGRQVEPLLPGNATCAVLITSRSGLSGLLARHGASAIELDTLSEKASRELVVRRIGAAREATDPAAMVELLGRCAGLPLALAIVGARAAMHPDLSLRAIAAELGEDDASLDGFETGGADLGLRGVFAASERALSTEAARLFRLLGAVRGPHVELRAAAALAGCAVPRTTVLLRELQEAHLLDQPTPHRYRMHDLVRAYVSEKAGSQEHATALDRLLGYYLCTADVAIRLTVPEVLPDALPTAAPDVPQRHFTGPAEAAAWLVAEHEVLLATTHQAHNSGWDDHAWRLASVLAQHLDRTSKFQQNLSLQQAGLASAERIGTPVALGRMHSCVARAYMRLRDEVPTAIRHLFAAIPFVTELGNRSAQILIHHNLAWAYQLCEDNRTGMRHAKRALALADSQRDDNLTVVALNGVGVLHSRLARARESLPYHRRALQLSERMGNQRRIADTLADLGYALLVLREFDDAIAHYKRAVAIHEDNSDHFNCASVLTRLGEVHAAAGQIDTARKIWGSCLDTLVELGVPPTENLHVELRTNLAEYDRR